MPCTDHAADLKATAQHVRWETACGLPARVRLLPATTWSSTKVVIRSIPISDAGDQCETNQHLSWMRKRVVAAHYKEDSLLNGWTRSLDISSYDVDFHEGYSTIGACRGAAWHVWINGTAWQVNDMGMACYVWIGLKRTGSSLFLDYLTVQAGALYFSETLVTICQLTWCIIQVDLNLGQHHCQPTAKTSNYAALVTVSFMNTSFY